MTKQKDTLVIMGTHPKGLKLFDWNRRDCDVWMFNEAANAKLKGKLVYPKTDAVFQLHHEAIWKNPKNRSDEKHYEWLTSGETPTVYMQEKFKEVPKSKKFPLKEILNLVKNVTIVINGKKKQFKYFSSSPDFAMALVAHMWRQGKKYEKVEIYGIELETESEYNFQRPGFGFWSGYLAALGIELVLYNSIFNAPMYGYEGDVAISSEHLEKRLKELTEEIGNKKEIYTNEAKIFLDSIQGLLKENISQKIEKELNEITKRNEQAGIINGKIKEITKYLEKAKAMEEVAKASVFSLGEFDQMRNVYTNQLMQVRSEAVNLNAQIAVLLKKLLNQKKGSKKRKIAIDEFGKMVAELMNKNMLILHLTGAIEENERYVNSVKLSFDKAKKNN